MLNKISRTLDVIAVPVSAKLTKPVVFKRRGVMFRFEPGERVLVDMETNISLICGYHVQLYIDDFIVLIPN